MYTLISIKAVFALIEVNKKDGLILSKCQVERFLIRSVRVLALLAPATALISNPSAFFGEVADRTLFFWAVVELMALLWCWLCLLDKSYRPRLQGITLMLSLTTLSLAVSTLLSHNRFLSFYSTFERMNGLLAFLHLYLFFLIISSTFRPGDWKLLLVSFFVAGVISSSVGFALYKERNIDGRFTGTLGNPSFYAAYLIFQIAVTCIMASYLWFSRRHKWIFLIIPAVFLLHFLSLIQTASRSGFASLVAGGLLFLLLASFRSRKSRYRMAGVLIAFIFLYLGAAQFIKDHPLPAGFAHLTRLFDISLKAETFLVRTNLWQVAWNAFREFPIFGWGFEGFSTAFLRFYDPLLYKDGLWYDNPHSFIFEWLINGGVLALAGFITCFSWSLYRIGTCPRIDWYTRSVLLSYGGAYIVFNLNNFDSISTLIPLFSLFAFSESCAQETGEARHQKAAVPVMLPILPLLLVAGSIGSMFYFFIIRSYQTNRSLSKAYSSANLAESTRIYDDAAKKALLGKYDIFIQFGLMRNRIAPDAAREQVRDYYVQARKSLGQGLALFPQSGQMLNQLGHLNVMAGQYQDAIRYFEQFRELAPKRQSNLMDLAICYLETGRSEEAVNLFRYIFDLNREFDLPLVYQAVGYAQIGDTASVKSAAAKVSDITLGNYGHILYLAYNNDDMRREFGKLFTGVCERQDVRFILQETYWAWIDAAFESGDDTSLEKAFACYIFNYNITEAEVRPILEEAIIHRKKPASLRKFARPKPM